MKLEQKEKTNYFLSQPHQPFFILGIVNAIAMMLIFALSYKGVLTLEIQNINFHVYSLIFTVFTNLFTGFLFTTFPRFCQSKIISKDFYSKIFFANAIGSILLIVGSITGFVLFFTAMGILFISQSFIVFKLYKTYKEGAAKGQDSYYILTANYFGLIGHFLFFTSLYITDISQIAVNLSFYMYLIFLTLTVAQRMIPFFSHSFEPKDERFLSALFVLFILKTTLSSIDGFAFINITEIILDTVLGLYLLGEFLRWKLPLFTSPSILWVLFLGLFWLPTAFIVSSISGILEIVLDYNFYFLSIHLMSIGFLTTILIGFGTRVTLGHSGQSPHADKIARNLFLFIQVVVILRALFSVNVAYSWGLNFLFDITFTAWIILFLLWSLRYGKVLVFGSKI